MKIKTFLYLFLGLVYVLGNLIFPKGDFSLITDIPEMYQECKQFEDKDMDMIAFITDHLFNIDGLFDTHINDQQKPHKPFQHQENNHTPLHINVKQYYTFKESVFKINSYKKMYFFSAQDVVLNMFKPPQAL